jgi:hypothetical protein
MKRIGAVVASSAAAAVVLAAAPAWASSAAAPAAAPLPCHAAMSNSHPRDYTTVYVEVHTASYAKVTTVAHYKTVNRQHTGKAGLKGNASIGYYISGATPGYKVVVHVHVVKGSRSGNCSTSFTPHR